MLIVVSSVFCDQKSLRRCARAATACVITPESTEGPIHVKVHINLLLVTIDGIVYIKGGHVSHTGQLFLNDTLTDEVAKLSPYKLHKIRRTRNDKDDIYRPSEGWTTLIPIQFHTPTGLEGPVKGNITLGVDPNAVPPPGGKRLRLSSHR